MPIANIFGFSTRPRAGSRAKAPSAFKGNPNKPPLLTVKSCPAVPTPLVVQPPSPVEEKVDLNLETLSPLPIARVTLNLKRSITPPSPPPPDLIHSKSSPDLKPAKAKSIKCKKSTGSLALDANVSGSSISTVSASGSTSPIPVVESPVHVRIKLPKGRVASYRYNIDYIMNGATVISERTATGGEREGDSGERRSLYRSPSPSFSSHSIESIEAPSIQHKTRRNHVRSHMRRGSFDAPPSPQRTKSNPSIHNHFPSFGSLPPSPTYSASFSSYQSSSEASDSESEMPDSPITPIGSFPSELDGICSHYEFASAMATAQANPSLDINDLPLLLTEPSMRQFGVKESLSATTVMNDVEALALFTAAKEARAIERASFSLSISETEHLARLEDARLRALRYKVVASLLLARKTQTSTRPIASRRVASTGQIRSSSRPRTAPAALSETEKETPFVLGGRRVRKEYVRSALGNMSTIAEV